MPYRLVYVVGFFLAAIADTTLICKSPPSPWWS